MTVKELEEKMKDKPSYSEEYKKFFNEEVNGHLAGSLDQDSKMLYGILIHSCVWLAGGYYVNFYQDRWGQKYGNSSYGFSVRLRKN